MKLKREINTPLALWKRNKKKCINAEAKTANKAKQFNLDYILIEKNISRILIEDYSFHGKIEKRKHLKFK